MIFAHLPAGFITTKILEKQLHITDQKERKYFYIIGLIFSIIPDFDVLYFYMFNSSIHHHKFFPHLPVFWLLFFSAAAIFVYFIKKPIWTYLFIVAMVNIIVHLILDSITAPLWWFYPLSDTAVMLIEVPARYSHWFISMILHWSFLLELLIIVTALYFLIQPKLKRQ